MTQRIEITNFGPIKNLYIEIKPILVLIGQQASGKSTVGKLIYFFKSLSSEFFMSYYGSPNAGIDITQDLIVPIREKFYDFFGSTFHLPDFNIRYYYNDGKYLTLTLTAQKKINARFSENFFSIDDRKELRIYKNRLRKIKEELENVDTVAKKIQLDEQHLDFLRKLADKINSIFNNQQNDFLYILAGRSATVGYSETFESLLQQNIQKNIEAQGHRAFEAREQTIDETLMLGFMQRVIKMRQLFNNLGNFDGIIKLANKSLTPKLELASKLVNNVLHGKYNNSNFGERIICKENGGYVYLKNASSGQQESIRILQDAFLSIYQSNNIFRIVEEPEAHLSPEGQKHTVQLLVLMLNHSISGQLILTTHSPYVLTSINNLICAANVGSCNRELVSKMIPEALWIKPDTIAAYMLTDGSALNIIDEELGEVKAELLDEISNEINKQYDDLLKIKYNAQE